MKKKENEDQGGWSVSESSTGESGKNMNPAALPGEPSTGGPMHYQEVPIGIPAGEEEYRKMKEAAANTELPPNEAAQADPAT